jgi:hypothetical protein
VVAGFGRGPVAPADQESAVEDVMLCGHGTMAFVGSPFSYRGCLPSG